MRILAIRRGSKSIRPKPDSKIEVDDVLIASDYAGGWESLKKRQSASRRSAECVARLLILNALTL